MLRLLVGYDVSGGRRSREVIRDTRDYRCGTSEADNRSYSRDVPDARTAPVDTPTRPCEPILAPLARLGSWLRRRSKGSQGRRTTEVPQRLRIHTDYAVAPPDFKREAYESRDAERGARQRHVHRDAVDATRRERVSPRRCRRII